MDRDPWREAAHEKRALCLYRMSPTQTMPRPAHCLVTAAISRYCLVTAAILPVLGISPHAELHGHLSWKVLHDGAEGSRQRLKPLKSCWHQRVCMTQITPGTRLCASGRDVTLRHRFASASPLTQHDQACVIAIT